MPCSRLRSRIAAITMSRTPRTRCRLAAVSRGAIFLPREARTREIAILMSGLLLIHEPEHTGSMARHGLCLIGIHRWVELRNPDGEPYIECSRCGQYREQDRPE